jgi:hypothetical protein
MGVALVVQCSRGLVSPLLVHVLELAELECLVVVVPGSLGFIYPVIHPCVMVFKLSLLVFHFLLLAYLISLVLELPLLVYLVFLVLEFLRLVSCFFAPMYSLISVELPTLVFFSRDFVFGYLMYESVVIVLVVVVVRFRRGGLGFPLIGFAIVRVQLVRVVLVVVVAIVTIIGVFVCVVVVAQVLVVVGHVGGWYTLFGVRRWRVVGVWVVIGQ